MVPLDYMLAVALLLSGPDPGGYACNEPCGGMPPGLEEHVCLGPTLGNLAAFWELVDPREQHLFFAQATDFSGDVQLLRRRYAELADAPPLGDAYRFPNVDTACELLRFNRDYFAGLQKKRAALGDHGQSIGPALAETDQLYKIWDLVRDAASECHYVSVRRLALAALRKTLGNRDYYTAKLPPHVPFWRFSRAD